MLPHPADANPADVVQFCPDNRLTSVGPTVSSGTGSISPDTHSNCLKCAYHRNRCFVGFFSLSLSCCFLVRRIVFAPAKKRTLVAEIEAFFRVVFDIVGRVPTVTRWICAGLFQVLVPRRLLLVIRWTGFPSAFFFTSACTIFTVSCW